MGTATVQFLLWRDKRKAAKAEESLPAIEPVESSSIEGDTSVGSREDDGKMASPFWVQNVDLS